MVGHAHGGDDAIDREHEVEHEDLADGHRETWRGAGDDAFLAMPGFGRDVLMDLARGLPDQERAPGNQDDVAPGNAFAKDREDRLGQRHDPGNRRQQAQAHHQRKSDPQPPRLLAHGFGQLVGQDGDENQVVDAEHDLHDHQCGQGGPGGRIARQRE
ncbi:hypothetical protein D3C71_1627230 [compost metagenome]